MARSRRGDGETQGGPGADDGGEAGIRPCAFGHGFRSPEGVNAARHGREADDEMSPAANPDPCLMHQGRGLQRLPRRLLRHLLRGNPAQILVNQRQQLVRTHPVFRAEAVEEQGEIVCHPLIVRDLLFPGK